VFEGGNGGSLKNQTIGFCLGRPSDHYYVDGIQGLTVVTQDAPCICEIQFKYVIVPSSDLCPFRAIGKSQDSDSTVVGFSTSTSPLIPSGPRD
jgi:hypothetical protein